MKTILATATNELWWMYMLQGALAIFFGGAALLWPGLTLVVLLYLFSIFVLLWGVAEIVHSGMTMQRETWWLSLIFGGLAAAVGVYLLIRPDVSFRAFVLLIGVTLIVRGIFDIVGAFVNQSTVLSKVLWAIAGALGVVVGIIVLQQPITGTLVLVWALGLYALFVGGMMIWVGFDLRRRLGELSGAM